METFLVTIKNLASSSLLTVTVILKEAESTDEFTLETTVDGITYQGTSEFFFTAFQILRDKLLSIGYGMNCCGALINAHQSPMMSFCDKVYLVALGKKALMKDTACIFDPAVPASYPNTVQQEAFKEAWFNSLQPPTR